MLIIDSKIPTTNIKIAKILPELIQGFIYYHLPQSEHIGYRHEKTGKIFKKTNFDFRLRGADLRVRFTSYEPKFEELIAIAVLKGGLNLGAICLTDTTVSIARHRVDSIDEPIKVSLKGCVACAVQGLLGHKVYLEPQDSRHLEMMKTNALQRFETITGYEYDGEFDIKLKWQNLEPFYFYYGNNRAPIRAWQAIWEVVAKDEIVNLILDTGVGSGCMSVGAGFLEIVKGNACQNTNLKF